MLSHMKYNFLPVIALAFIPFAEAKLIDIHIPTSEDLRLEEEMRRARELDHLYDVINNQDASAQEKDEAYHELFEKGELS